MFKKLFPYFISVAVSLGIGGISALLTKDNMSVYSDLNRPPFSPQPEIFPIVWSILFVLMGIAAALVWCSNKTQSDDALLFYGAQLTFNFCWTLIFFNLRAFLFAFIWLTALSVLIGITTVKFYKLNKTAGFLMVPYFLWVCFAGYLNFMIWMLN